ncbi:MAG: AAA family ATPase [Ilumatobacteraceae bacterium]
MKGEPIVRSEAAGELVVVSGPPGAGKSTVASRLVERGTRSALVEGDAVFGFLRQGFIDPWLPESRRQNDVVTGAAAAVAGRFAAGGYWTVYDGVVGPWYLDDFFAATALDALHYAVLLPPAATCVARVTGRRDHGFTDPQATLRMHAQFSAAKLDRRHVFDDADCDVLAELVLDAVRSGTIQTT